MGSVSRQPRAILWDMDGTLVDTEPYWMAAERELVASHGGTWTSEDALQLVGKGLLDSGAILRAAGVDMQPSEIVDHLTHEVRIALRDRGVPFRPGARELLLDLKKAGIPTGLVTMSLRDMALDVVGLIGFDAFDVVVAGDDVDNPKPHPEPYLQGAALLDVDITHSVVIEDSPTGVRSGLAAGAVTLGIPHIVPLDGLGAHELWPTLGGRGSAHLVDLFDRIRTEPGETR